MLGAAAHDGHRRLDRLLHHLAELAGVLQLALARHDRGLDGQQLAADFRPGEARDLADAVLLLGLAVAEAPHAEELVEVLRRDRDRLLVLLGLSSSCLTALRQIFAISRSRLRTPASRV